MADSVDARKSFKILLSSDTRKRRETKKIETNGERAKVSE